MGPESENYYLSLTVDGRSKYYLKPWGGAGPVDGRSLEPIDLYGEVDRFALKAVLAGTTRSPGRGVRGAAAEVDATSSS